MNGLRSRTIPRTLRSTPWRDVDLWAVDLETSGLDAKRDQILSVGMVPIRGGTIHLGEAYYSLTRPRERIALDGLPAHHILPGELDRGRDLSEILEDIDPRLEGSVLVAHHSAVERAFLKRASREYLGRPFEHPILDTLDTFERVARRERMLGASIPRAPLGLAAAREYLGLPPHNEHHALWDALATAELLLVLAARLDAARLGELA